MWTFPKLGNGNSAAPNSSAARQVFPSRKTARIWIERLLLISGLSLLIFYGAGRLESIIASRSALEAFAALDSSHPSLNANADGDAQPAQQPNAPPASASSEASSSPRASDLRQASAPPAADFSLWDSHRVQAYRQSVAKQSHAPLGVLRIPKIHLEVPLLEGTDDLILDHAVGRIAGTARPGDPGNIGIAGHRDSFFRGLKDVRVGDAIELKTLKGTNTYVVDRIQIVTPDDVQVLRPTALPSLTLVTCYPFYFIGSAPERYIVTASLSRGIHGRSGI